MPILVAPSDQAVPGGTTIAPNVVARAALNTGDTVTFGFASAAHDVGVTRATFDTDLYDTFPGSRFVNHDTPWTTVDLVLSYTATAPTPIALVLQGGGEPKDSSHGIVHGYHAEITLAAVTYCAHGTRLKAGSSFVYYLTPGLIDVWLAALELPWLAPLFTAFWFTSFDASALCGSGPPPFPTIDLSTLDASATTVLQLLKCIAWPNVCECTPGAPAPTPYPIPTPTEPVGWPSPVVFSCSDTDICATLIAMRDQLAAVQAVLSDVQSLTTLMQRYQLPFAYIPGATHSGLTGSGSFAIPRCVGVKVTVRSAPAGHRILTGTPNYLFDLGWLSVLNGDGMIDEVRLTRSDQVWVSRLFATATTFGYALRDGVDADVEELYAEP